MHGQTQTVMNQPSKQAPQIFLRIFCPKGMKLIVYQQYAIVKITTQSNTSPFTFVANAITMVRMIIVMQTTDGIILSFFFMALQWPLGVERKQLAEILRIWQKEKTKANVTTWSPPKMNKKVRIHEMTKPVMEHARNPMTLCLRVMSPHKESSLPPENILSLSSLLPRSFPIRQFKVIILSGKENHNEYHNEYHYHYQYEYQLQQPPQSQLFY